MFILRCSSKSFQSRVFFRIKKTPRQHSSKEDRGEVRHKKSETKKSEIIATRSRITAATSDRVSNRIQRTGVFRNNISKTCYFFINPFHRKLSSYIGLVKVLCIYSAIEITAFSKLLLQICKKCLLLSLELF